MASTRFDERLAQVLADIRASGTGVEQWVDPILGIEARTPEEEQQKTGMLATIGSLLHEPKRRVDIAMNYYANTGLRRKVLSGGEPVPTGVLAKEAYIGPPEPYQDPVEQHLRAAGRGVMERWIDVSTDPALFAIPPALKAVPTFLGARAASAAMKAGAAPYVVEAARAAAAAKAANTLHWTAGLGFTAAMAKDAVHQADRTYQSYKREGWSPSTSEEAAKTAFDVGMLGTMVPGFIPRRGRARPAEPIPEEPGGLAPRPPLEPRPIPGAGIPEDVYGRAQEDFLRGRRPGLPPGEIVEPPPPPPPTVPGQPRIREVNIPDSPERLADDAMLGQITAIRSAIQSALEGGNIDRAQELRRHAERFQDLYRARRYAPGVQVGRAGDMMQLREQLQAELAGGAGIGRQLEIREALSVLDAEIDLTRAATAVPEMPPAEAAPTGISPAPPPQPGVPETSAPPGPLPSRAPQVTPGAMAPGLPPPTPELAAAADVAASRQPTQELLERAQAETAGLPPPAGGPLATVLEGGEPAGAAVRLMEPEVLPPARPAPVGEALPGPSALPGMPGGPPLDIQLAPAGAPRLGARPARGPALAAPTTVAAEPQRAELPPSKMTVTPPPPEPTAEGEQVDLAEVARAAAEPEAKPAEAPPEAPAGPESFAMDTFPNPRRGLSSEQARKKSQNAQTRWIDYDGKPMFITSHITARGQVALQGPRDVASPGTGPGVRKLAGTLTRPATIAGWQRGADPKNQPVWFESKTKGGKPIYSAIDGDYFRTLNKLAEKNAGSEWRMSVAAGPVGLFDKDGGLLGIVAPLNEKGPPPPLAPATPRPAPEVPERMRAAAKELEAELAGEPVPEAPSPEATVRLWRVETRGVGPSGPMPSWMQGNEVYEDTKKAAGRWFTDDPGEARYYLEDNPGAKVTFVDVPIAQAEQYRVSNLEPGHPARGYSRRHEQEFFLPRDLADRADAAPPGNPVESAPMPERLVEALSQRQREKAAYAAAARAEQLEAENAALREQHAQQIADENERLRTELEETRATEGDGVGPAPPEILPRPGEEAEGGGEVRGVPEPARGDVGEGLPAERGGGPEPYPGGRGREGRELPEARAVPASERSVTTESPVAGEPIAELRADGEAAVVEPLDTPPAAAPKREGKPFVWTPGELERTEGRSMRTKATDNLAAVRLLKGLEAADRVATPEEAQALAGFVGWGGMPRIFKDYDYGAEADFWQEKHKELQAALTPEEYEAAKASVTNAHFTREEVIRGMWDGIVQMGGGRGLRVLEPSMGVGNFFSAMPSTVRPAHLTGVELDPVTGRIAKRLFPAGNIHVGGFESTPIPDNYFDVAISNVPFGSFGVADSRFRDEPFLTKRIHNYFFAKALDKVRPGGVVAFITSHYTMDAKDRAFRGYIAEKAWLVGAVRLPRTTFERNAGTGVTTDVIYLQKKVEGQDRPEWAAPDTWTETVVRDDFRDQYGRTVAPNLNRYFHENPKQVLGDLAIGDGTGGATELTVAGKFDADRFKGAIRGMGAPDILERAAAPPAAPPVATAEELRRMKPGSLSVREGKIWVLEPDGTFLETGFPKSSVPVATAWIPIRDAARDVIATQLERGTDTELAQAQKQLGKAYDSFVRKHGPLHGRAVRAFDDDPDFPLTLALEDWKAPVYRKEGKKRVLVSEGKATKRDIFTKRTVAGYAPPTSAGSPQAAYSIALAERGHIDVDRIASLIGETPSGALRRVLEDGLAYEDPANDGSLESAETYLSGNVVSKLEQAQAAAAEEPERFRRNVAALEAVQPTPLRPDEVTVQLGASWVPTEVYEEFAGTELGGATSGREVRIRHSEGLGAYKIDYDHRLTYSAAATSTYGTAARNAFELFDDGMNLRMPTVYKGSGDDRRIDEEATALARDKLDQIREKFGSWIWSNPDRAGKLIDLYNRTMNKERLRTPDGSHLAFHGMNRAVLRGGDLEPHQKNDAWRILTQPNTLIAEPVGSGKTWTLVAAAMEARRMGQVKKPMLAVPNDTFGQWGEEWSRLYPQAKLLIVDPDQLVGKARAHTMSRIATEEWDGILVTHEALKSLPVSAKAMESVVREEIAMLDQTLRELSDAMGEDESIEEFTARATAKGRRGSSLSRSDTKLVKQIEKQKAALKAKLEKLYEQTKRDKTIAFDELGVDMLLVDESHYFNNLAFSTKLGRVKGISNENAGRAFDLYVKVKTLQRQQNGRGVVFATATPIRNTLAELYTLFRYLNPEFLKERGLRHFDDWVRAFAQSRVALELKPTGTGYRSVTRFSTFVNVPELLTAFRNYTAVMTAEDLKLPVPDIAVNSKGERRPNFIDIEPSKELRQFVSTLERRAAALKGKKPEKGEDNMLNVTGDGRKAAIDLAMVGRAAEPAAGQKLDVLRQRVFDRWKRTTPTRGVQAVFLDLSTPDAQPFSAYRWLRDRWIEMGVPAGEIDFAHNYTRQTKKELFGKLNRSEVRIVLGSTKKLGVGANFQQNVVAMSHVDVPWTPDGYEQRNGRGIRQGNVNAEVEIDNYVSKGTFDAYMWQILSSKAGFIGQVMTGKATARTLEDVSLTYLTAQEALAATSENPMVVKKIQLEADLRKYERLQGAHQLELYELGNRRADWERQVAFHTDKARDILDAVRQLGAGKNLELFEAPGQDPMAAAKETFDKRTDEAGDALKALIEGIAPGPGTYYVGRYRNFPIWVRRQQAKDAVFTDVRLPTPSRVAELGEQQIAVGTEWRPQYTGSGGGLLQSMDAQTPTEADATSHAGRAVAKKNELAKLQVPEFRYNTELERVKRELAAVNEELKTEKDDSEAAKLEDDPTDEGGEPAEDADYEAGETGEAADEDLDELDEGITPPVDPGGGAGGAGKPPGRKPPGPGDDGDATPDGMPSNGPQPGESGWQRRVREASARNRKRARGGQANAGIDPMHMADIAIEGANLVLRGLRRFGAWSREMLRTLGSLVPGLRGMLRGLWNWVREMFSKSGRGPQPGTRAAGERRRPGFEEYRTEYQEATAGQPGAGRRRYPFEEREIPPEEVRAAAEEGARVGQEPPPKYGKPPKADVNFDRIGGEPDIREWQARVVESLKPRWGKIRSFRSWAEARESAVRAGLSEQDFIQLVKERGVVTDIEIEAGRMMRQQGAESAFAKLERLKELQARRKGETDPQAQRRLDEEILEADREYRDALARYVAVTSATVEAASELGRALNIHRKMAEAITPEESFFRNLLRKHPGMSEQMQAELADAVMRRDATKIRELARKLYKPGPLDYASEWFVNSLLSGLTTLEVNVLGNLSWEALFRTPERALAAGIEAAGGRQWVERIFGKDALPRERFGREFEEALRTHVTNRFGMLRSLKYAWEFVLNEPAAAGAKGEFRPPAFTGFLGKVIRTPSRMMYALDLGSRWAAMEAEASVQAVRRAIMESRESGGWTRDQVTKRMRELQDGYRRYAELEARRQSGEVLAKEDYQFLAKNPMYGRWQAAVKQAGAKATFTDNVDRFSGALLQMREAHPWLTFFVPFIKTPSRILAAALERSPFGAYDTFRKAKSGELRGGELTDAMARVVYGNMLGASLYLLARQGLVSGSGPADPRERAVKMKTGWRPYAVKVGDTWVEMSRLEPLGTHLGWAADLAEAQNARGASELYDKLIQGISLNLVNKTYLQGAVGLAEAVGDPERYGAAFGRKTLGAFVPNLLAQAARAIDPTVRETDSIAGTLLSRIPIASATLPARRTGTGEAITREETAVSRFINPFRYSTEKGPEANLERIFLDVGYIPSNAPKTITVPGTGGRKVALQSEERQLYSDFKERATRFARGLAQNEQFLALEPSQQEELLKRLYRYAHDGAHKAMVASVMKRAGSVEWVK